jgi:hypothetical protein
VSWQNQDDDELMIYCDLVLERHLIRQRMLAAITMVVRFLRL